MFGAEYHIINGYGCPKCRAKATDGQCCADPIRYTCVTRIIHGQEVDIDFATWPTVTTPHWCEVHQVASSHPQCIDCLFGVVCTDRTPAQVQRAERMAQLKAESPIALDSDDDPTAKAGDGVYGDDTTPPQRSYREMGWTRPASENEENATMATKKAKKSPTPSPNTRKTRAKKKPTASAPEEKDGPDRTGMVQRELNETDITKRGRELAKQERKLQKKTKEKARQNKIYNEEIHTLEEVIAELSEQVDTGFEWVPAQTSIPGTDAAAE